MEDTLWELQSCKKLAKVTSLNPYSNGRYSMGKTVTGCYLGLPTVES